MNGTRQLTIDGVQIGDDAPCYVVAEIGHNHQGDEDQPRQQASAARRGAGEAQSRGSSAQFRHFVLMTSKGRLRRETFDVGGGLERDHS